MICELCGKVCNNLRILGIHLNKTHKLSDTQNYYDTYLRKNINENICKNCGNHTKYMGLKGYRTYCSHQCQVSCSDTIEKSRKTKFEHFGEGNYFSNIGKDNISKYQSEIASERMKTTINKLKKEYNIPDNIEITNISQIQQIKDKVANTNLNNCGNICSLHGTNQIKTNKAFEIKYGEGITSPLQVHEIRRKSKKKFVYNNIEFDSKWELAYFIWLKDNNIAFEYQPCTLTYYFNGKQKKYYPDFRLINENILVEIKNPYLLNNMQNDINSKEYHKYMCIIENNVKIIDNCEKYINYVNSTYGPELLKNCKRIKRSRKRTKVEVG